MTEKKLVGTSLCDRCKKTIQGNPDDPVNMTSEGTFHSKCMRDHYAELNAKEAEKEAKKAGKKVVKEVKEEPPKKVKGKKTVKKMTVPKKKTSSKKKKTTNK